MAAIMVIGYRRGTTELKPIFGTPLCKFAGPTPWKRLPGINSRCIQPDTRKLRGMSSSFNRVLDPVRLLRIAAVVVTAFSSGANAGDAVVGRASPADISERVVDLVNAARSNSRRC